MRKRTASGKAHPVGGNHFGVFPWVFVSLRRSFTRKKEEKKSLPTHDKKVRSEISFQTSPHSL